MIKILYLILGGSLGTLLRYLVSLLSVRYMWGGLPLGTMAVNLIGSFCIGFSFAFFEREPLSEPWRLFLFVGLFGSFTTFSTFMFEGYDMIKMGDLKTAAIYLFSSNVLGLLLVFLGWYWGAKWA